MESMVTEPLVNNNKILLDYSVQSERSKSREKTVRRPADTLHIAPLLRGHAVRQNAGPISSHSSAK